MGLIGRILGVIFGDGRNVVKETAEVFRVNAEGDAVRAHLEGAAALEQFGREFALARVGRFDRFMDALNRVPRPAMALGTLGLFVAAMVDPLWFASRMQGIALVPEPLWWLLGAIVSFYFGARYQVKGQEFQREVAATMARVPQVAENLRRLGEVRDAAAEPLVATADPGPEAEVQIAVTEPSDNPALDEWRRLSA